MDKLKVGILTKPIEDGKSGSGSHLLNLLNHVLLSDNAEQIEFTLIHYKKSDNEIFKKAKELIISRNPFLASYQLNRLKFDVIHYSPLTIFSPIFVNAKKVATLHGDMQHFLTGQYKLIDRLHKRYIVRNYARMMDYVFTTSKTSKSYFRDEYKIKEDRLSVVYAAVSSDFGRKEESEIKEFLACKKIFNPYIFHLSRFSERKNPWCLIDAFAKVSKKNKNLKLLIGGFGWDTEKMKRRLDELEIRDKVELLGFLSLEEMVLYLNGAAMFVFPSFYEGFGMPNLEAAKCGCPVITTNLFAIPEIVGKGALLLDDPNDYVKLSIMIDDLLKNKKLKEQLVLDGYQNIKRFSWVESADRTISVYKQVINNS